MSLTFFSSVMRNQDIFTNRQLYWKCFAQSQFRETIIFNIIIEVCISPRVRTLRIQIARLFTVSSQANWVPSLGPRGDTLAREKGGGGAIPTMVQTLWYSRCTIIPLRVRRKWWWVRRKLWWVRCISNQLGLGMGLVRQFILREWSTDMKDIYALFVFKNHIINWIN